MTGNVKRSIVCVATASLLAASGCTRYEQKPLPFRMPSAYPNMTAVFGATLAARSFDDPATAKEYFGFDILGAGVLPVQLVIDHQGTDPMQIDTAQTFLIDDKEQVWNILDQKLAYSRIEKKTELGNVAPEAAKSGLLGATAGAIVGAAIAIVTGTNIGEGIGKGAAVGGAGGAVLGGGMAMDDSSVRRAINEDLRNRSLENRPIPPQSLSHGVLFFPVEAAKARKLRLRIKDTVSGETRLLEFAL